MTPTEQEYLKHIYLFTSEKGDIMHTKQLAELVNVKPASVTDIVKRLAKKEVLIYNRYHGFSLSKSGKKEAIQVIRRHRLWELFLGEKLGIDWKDIHQIAAQLQSIKNDVLIEKLSSYLGHPAFDPHGEPIPDKNGKFHDTNSLEIDGLKTNQPAIVFGYRDTGKEFLRHIEKINLLIGTEVVVISQIAYDHSVEILIKNKTKSNLSKEVAQKINVRAIGKQEHYHQLIYLKDKSKHS